ncbi:MAG: hypothetical protein H7246_07570 [Phycisphaerae bacterium]|nr:hypothetical protein [Saprospiraceae bacterium]
MNKHYLSVALLSLLSLASCKNTPAAPPKPATPSTSEDSTKSSTPDPNDLLRTLQGRWQSEQDAAYTLEIADIQMRHYNGGQLSYQSTIEVDGACEIYVCKLDSVDTSDGWCFTETTVEQGKNGAQCNFVVVCDTSRLQYRSLSSGGSGLSFKKIQ